MKTPNANRLHIGIFGKRNSGKSSILNMLTNQDVSLVSDILGTTTDPVFKPIEIHSIGACVLIDTAGIDDIGELGEKRVKATRKVIDRTDIAVMVFSDFDLEFEKEWIENIRTKKIPVLAVINKADLIDSSSLKKLIYDTFKLEAAILDNKKDVSQLIPHLVRILPSNFEEISIVGHLVDKNDVVLLVMPQDGEAPKGRLILPQVQTIRDLLDNQCIVISTTLETLELSLSSLKKSPKLIITDSQVFFEVYKLKPADSLLTSFSLLFASYKGDIGQLLEGAKKLDHLVAGDRILIAEACTHNALDGDIGRVKIPKLLSNKVRANLDIDIVAGVNFPDDISKYSLVIHCGGCMFNRKYILSRIDSCNNQNIPITNYGIAIAKLTGILDKIEIGV